MRPEDIEVCLKPPARDDDVVITADLMTFTKVWLGYVGFANAVESGKVSLHGSGRAMATARRLLALPDQPTLKTFRFQRSRLLARLPHNVPARATAAYARNPQTSNPAEKGHAALECRLRAKNAKNSR